MNRNTPLPQSLGGGGDGIAFASSRRESQKMAEDSLSSLLAAYSSRSHHRERERERESTPSMDEEDMKKYLVSPSTASAGTPQEAHTSNAAATTNIFPAGPPAAAGSLESALAALGENGRQQLLAILQLANSNNALGPHSATSPQQPLSNATALSANGRDATGLGNRPDAAATLNLTDPLSENAESSSKTAKKAKADQQASSSSASTKSSSSSSNASSSAKKRKSQAMMHNGSTMGSVSNGSSVANANDSASMGMSPIVAATSPAYFANAFSQYSLQQQQQSAHSQQPALRQSNNTDGGSGSTPSSGSSKPSPALSAITSYSAASRAPAAPSARQGSTGNSFTAATNTVRIPGAGGSASVRHTPSNSVSGLEGMAFRLPDANHYRSPAIAPGTSSSAFYTDSGLGEDGDVSYTTGLGPLMPVAQG